jgi:DeoR family ulaG and ulaABCDEF operon transcriptional repressor
MLERERQETILRLLALHPFVTIHDVVDAIGVSEATTRRMFAAMEAAGMLRRVRGGIELPDPAAAAVVGSAGSAGSAAVAAGVASGAVPGSVPGAAHGKAHGKALGAALGAATRAGVTILPYQAESSLGQRHEAPLDSRISVNHEKKRRIARKAVAMIGQGETIFIDGGSTTFHMVEFLATMDLTVVTNSFAIAEHLVRHSRCTVILPEGTVNPESLLILNNLCADPFANYHANRAFMGIEGITETVLTNSVPLLIQTERAMIAHARELVILADGSKFGRIGSLTLCPVQKASCIITTADADPAMVRTLRELGVTILIV